MQANGSAVCSASWAHLEPKPRPRSRHFAATSRTRWCWHLIACKHPNDDAGRWFHSKVGCDIFSPLVAHSSCSLTPPELSAFSNALQHCTNTLDVEQQSHSSVHENNCNHNKHSSRLRPFLASYSCRPTHLGPHILHPQALCLHPRCLPFTEPQCMLSQCILHF